MRITPQYIIRLDDACPSMDQKKWARMEEILDKYHIKPIVGVIPDNQDPKCVINQPDENFWDRVSGVWQAKGWAIALHGYQHKYVTDQGGLVPINQKSEFAGLSLAAQKEKIKKAWQVFQSHNIIPKIWVAPSHTFDINTLKALQQETNIKIISDGIAFKEYYEYGFHWIPQQFWRFRKMPFGTYTICLHPNTMQDKDFESLERTLAMHQNRFINVQNLELTKRKKTVIEFFLTKIFFILLKLKRCF
jgi:predicted deacetylase